MTKLLLNVVKIAENAGKEILKVYESSDFNVEIKGDGSPLTTADRRAHNLIEEELRALTPNIPILSEESSIDTMQERQNWNTFWLVDPLDGTKEFVKRNGEFTVNIALIDNGKPIMGVVHTPVQRINHYAEKDIGAFRSDHHGTQSITVRQIDLDNVVMVASRSHRGEAVDSYHANLVQYANKVEITSMGSSLKICLIAEGKADIYPRLGPTSEWDTAAAHCVLETAGGSMQQLTGIPLLYNKTNILNPWFLACGSSEVDWLSFSRKIKES